MINSGTKSHFIVEVLNNYSCLASVASSGDSWYADAGSYLASVSVTYIWNLQKLFSYLPDSETLVVLKT
jgi:hypothetical protein